MAHLDLLQKEGSSMPFHARLLELNKARVGFKHYGNLPAAEEAKKYRTYVGDSLRQAMREHFDVSFDDLSLASMVENEEIRTLLQEAENFMAKEDYWHAAEELAKARNSAFSLMQRYLPIVNGNLSSADQLFEKSNARVGMRRSDQTNVRPFAYLSRYLHALREATLSAMFHLPLNDSALLRNKLPSAWRAGPQGRWSVNHSISSYTETDCKRALTAIIGLCQRLQQRI